jgi:hypothetical protein
MSYRNLIEHPGPKKLLALDGGGIRGVITLEVLQRIESMLAQQFGAGDTFVPALMYAALNEQDLLCRVFGRCRHGAPIDREVGDLIQGEGLLKDRLFSYVRYNAELSRRGLDELGLYDVVPENVHKLDSVQYVGDLRRVGRAVAVDVTLEHFDGFLQAAP